MGGLIVRWRLDHAKEFQRSRNARNEFAHSYPKCANANIDVASQFHSTDSSASHSQSSHFCRWHICDCKFSLRVDMDPVNDHSLEIDHPQKI